MSEENRISYDTYLKALALFTMANHLYVECRKAQLMTDKMLNLEDGSHVDDAVYNSSLASPSDFDEALAREKIIVPARRN